MPYSLDSNVCIAVMNKRASNRLSNRLDDAIRREEALFVSSIVAHELWFGVSASVRPAENAQRLREFLGAPFHVLKFDEHDARAAGEIRAQLRKQGTPIGSYDVLIAGQALARNLTLVTGNTREFGRVGGLKVEDWG